MDQLKLIAFDAEDLNVLSAHVQDAVVRVGDMAYLAREKRFAAVVNRFDWARALNNGGKDLARLRSALRFERVLAARTYGFELGAKDEVMALLAVAFSAHAPDDPAGTVTLTFSGDAAIQLDVECLEAELRDLGAVWKTRSRPQHPVD